MAHQQRRPSSAQQLGKALAYLQDTIDLAVTWGFHRMKKVQVPASEEIDGAKGWVKLAATKVLRFIGESGESFYDEYELLKKKRSR